MVEEAAKEINKSRLEVENMVESLMKLVVYLPCNLVIPLIDRARVEFCGRGNGLGGVGCD